MRVANTVLTKCNWLAIFVIAVFLCFSPACHSQTQVPATVKPSPDSKLLAPIKLVENYVSTSYLPSVTWMRDAEGNSREWDLRDYIIYVAGPAGRHLSFWIEPHPLNKPGGFFTKFEMLQGSLFAGNSKRFGLLRGGQIFALENAGFAGADRVITQTQPLMFAETNGVSPSETIKGLSAELTLPRLLTGKVFWGYAEKPRTEIEEDEEGAGAAEEAAEAAEEAVEEAKKALEEAEEAGLGVEGAAAALEAAEAKAAALEKAAAAPHLKTFKFQQPRYIGFTIEKVFGKSGLSGIQSQYITGNMPVAITRTSFLPVNDGLTPISTLPIKNPVRFQQWYLLGNKTFLDKKNFERANFIYGFGLRRDSWFIDSETGMKSWGYGQFAELDAFLVPSYLTAIVRYDQFRPTNRIKDNTQFGVTVGLAFDLHGPRRSRGRITFDYQLIAREEGRPIQRFILAWRPIF